MSLITNGYSQETFEFFHSNTYDEITKCIVEDDLANIYFPVENPMNAQILKLNYEGIVTDSIIITNPDGTCILSELIYIDQNQIVALGDWEVDSLSNLWYVKFNSDLEIVNNKLLDSYGYKIFDFKHIINHNNNIVFLALYNSNGSYFHECLYEISMDGTVIRSSFFNNLTFNQGFSLLENDQIHTYKIFSLFPLGDRLSCFVNLVDTNFIIYDTIYLLDYINNQNTAKWIDNATYILTGKMHFGEEWDLGILKLTDSDSIIKSVYIGSEDTVEWAGLYKNLDFISTENIFFAGTKNSWWFPFQQEPSWIMLNILDSDLNLKHQQFYGGDAYYLVNAILATRDSGCVMACSRYDYLTQDEEFDVYILKVNKDGLLVGTPETTDENENQIRLYPNPGSESLTIDIPKPGYLLEMADISGIVRLSRKLEDRHNTVPVASLPAGLYIYRIVNKEYKTIGAGKWIKLKL